MLPALSGLPGDARREWVRETTQYLETSGAAYRPHGSRRRAEFTKDFKRREIKELVSCFIVQHNEKIPLNDMDIPETVHVPLYILNDPEDILPNSCVYFIRSAGLTKIGLTTNLENRLRSLATMSPVPITLGIALEAPEEELSNLESFFHNLFVSKRKHGEWFKLNRYDFELIRHFAQFKDRGNIATAYYHRAKKRWKYKPIQKSALQISAFVAGHIVLGYGLYSYIMARLG